MQIQILFWVASFPSVSKLKLALMSFNVAAMLALNGEAQKLISKWIQYPIPSHPEKPTHYSKNSTQTQLHSTPYPTPVPSKEENYQFRNGMAVVVPLVDG